MPDFRVIDAQGRLKVSGGTRGDQGPTGPDGNIADPTHRQPGATWPAWVNGGTTLETFGYTNGVSVTGNTQSNVEDARRIWRRNNTAATSGTQAVIRTTSTSGYILPHHNPYFASRVRLGSDISSIRFWCGCFAQSNTSSTADGAPNADTLINKDRKSTRLNSSHIQKSRMPSSA